MMEDTLSDRLPPMRSFGQDYGPFAMDTEPGYALGGSRVESHAQGGDEGSSAATSGAFYYVYQTEVTGTDYWFLQGGTVTGTASVKTVANLNIGTVGSEPADGTDVWLMVTGNPVEEDDVLLPGFTITAEPSMGSGASTPEDEAVAPGDTGKDCYVHLGSWTNGVFLPDDVGNITVTYCAGTFRKTRD